jgi:quinol monooxygenase YgiN
MFEATAKLKIRQGQLESFKRQAAELMRQMREEDEQPLRYDWFLSADGTECEVREAYDSADALLAHQPPIAEAKMKLFREHLDGHTMIFYGEPSPALTHALQAMGTTYQQFSFFQGLEANSETSPTRSARKEGARGIEPSRGIGAVGRAPPVLRGGRGGRADPPDSPCRVDCLDLGRRGGRARPNRTRHHL